MSSKGGKSIGKNRDNLTNGGRSQHRQQNQQQQQQQQLLHQLNHQQYQQFVNNAIERGRGGHNHNMMRGYGQIQFLPSNGILQALQGNNSIPTNQQHLLQQQQMLNFPNSSNNLMMMGGNGNLGSLFQDMSLGNKSKSSSSSNKGTFNSREKKIKNGGGFVNNVVQTNQETHEEMTKRLNNEALLRVDIEFKGLIGTASQVAVYDYDVVTKDWIDTKMAGPLFLYNRSSIPEYGLVVLNRKGMKNLNVIFDKQSQIIPHKPYLLFRRGPDEVHLIKCIWFYKETEFHEALNLFQTIGVQFDKCDSNDIKPSTSSTNLSTHGNKNSKESGPNLFDLLKQSQAKIDGSATLLPMLGAKSKTIFTAEELEEQMMSDFSPTDKLVATGPTETLNHVVNSMGGGLALGGAILANVGGAEGGVSLLQHLNAAQPTNSHRTAGSSNRGPKRESGDSDDSIPLRLNDASRSMRTVEQLEKSLMPNDSKIDMSNELLATLGIKPIKDFAESSSEVYTPPSSISDSERSQRKLTIDDLDGKLYEETDEDMVREVVENLADLTELLLLPENVIGHSEPQLVWRKRSNLRNRPPSALVQVPHTNGLSNGTPNMHQKHSIINNRSSPAISPLTESQLLQAITYLLQTDSSFIGKIHKAYINSLQQGWATNRFD